MKLLKNRSNITISFFVYGLGLASLLASDIFISATFTKTEVARWAFLKSFLLIGAGFCVLGSDQVVVRNPNYIRTITQSFFKQSLISALVISILTSYLNNYYHLSFLLATLTIMSISVFYSGVFRALFFFTSAQILTNGWKIAFGFILCFCILFEYDIDIAIVILLALTASISICALTLFSKKCRDKLLRPETDTTVNEKTSDDNLRAVGLTFFFHNATLLVAAHGEQFIVNLSGAIESSTLLFSHFSAFCPIIIGMNGFAGFIASPIIRKRPSISKIFINKFIAINAALSLSLILVSYMIGLAIFDYAYANKYPLNNFLVAIFMCICFLRNIYIIPSSIIGTKGTYGTLSITAKLNWSFLFIYLIMCYSSIHHFGDTSMSIAIACSGLIHWGLRCGSGLYFSYKLAN